MGFLYKLLPHDDQEFCQFLSHPTIRISCGAQHITLLDKFRHKSHRLPAGRSAHRQLDAGLGALIVY